MSSMIWIRKRKARAADAGCHEGNAVRDAARFDEPLVEHAKKGVIDNEEAGPVDNFPALR